MLKEFYSENMLEVGIDEAGRGPLFGPVYVGAVIAPRDDPVFSQLRDSKKLSESRRLEAFDYIKEMAIDYSIISADCNVIDKKNIYNATYELMHEAIRKLTVVPDLILADGNQFFTYEHEGKEIPHECIIKGDDTYTCIAAASILAKVSRDKYIEKLCDENPELNEKYKIRSNKGYGAKAHIDGIKEYGITKWHRKTFGICKQFAPYMMLSDSDDE